MSVWDEPLMWFGAVGGAGLIIAGAWNHQPWLMAAGLLIVILYFHALQD